MKRASRFFVSIALGGGALALGIAEAKTKDEKVELELQLERESILRITANMPQKASSVGVSRAGEAEQVPECGDAALRISRWALDNAELGPAAWEAAKVSFDIAKDVAEQFYGIKYAGIAAELVMKVLESNDALDFVKGTGEVLVDVVAGGLAENKSEFYPWTKGASEGAKYTYNKILEGQPGTLVDREWTHPRCGKIRIHYWLIRGAEGMRLVVTVDGNCQRAEGTAPPLGAFYVRGSFKLEQRQALKSGKVRVSYVLPQRGSWDVFASCSEQAAAPGPSPDSPTETENAFFSSDQYNTTDRVCRDRCWQARMAWQDAAAGADEAARRSRLRRSAARAKGQQAAEPLAEADAIRRRYEEAQAFLTQTRQGTVSSEDQEKLRRSTDVVRAYTQMNAQEERKLRDEAARIRSEAEKLTVLAASSESDAAARKSSAVPLRQTYNACLRRCIDDACSTGQGFGKGGWSPWMPPYGQEIQRDVFAMQAALGKAGQGGCSTTIPVPAPGTVTARSGKLSKTADVLPRKEPQ